MQTRSDKRDYQSPELEMIPCPFPDPIAASGMATGDSGDEGYGKIEPFDN